ncbi:MAG: putative rane protein [Oscillospiraceae bacterium]|jgi:uncharacterized membrane protein|nr:putative rane protein [Oscillospiraceae bacterium]
MTKAEFIRNLSSLIEALPQGEKQKAIDFYCEIIDDRMENGKTEEEAVAELGSILAISQKILAESGQNANYNNYYKSSQSYAAPSHGGWTKDWFGGLSKGWLIVILVLTSPIWIGLVAGVVGIIIGLLGAVLGIVVSLFAAVFALAVACLVGFISSFIVMSTNPIGGFAQLGASLLCGGLCILLCIGSVSLIKLLVKGFRSGYQSVKNKIHRKGGVAVG